MPYGALPPPPRPPRRATGTWGGWIRLVLGAALAAITLRACVFEAYRIPSTSMDETLRPGDFVFVSKLHYGVRLPGTLGVPFRTDRARLPFGPDDRLPGLSSVSRGDVVVFHVPAEGGPVEARTPYVKRVVGLPGDTVELRAKLAYVNGMAMDRPPDGRLFWEVRLDSSGGFPPPETLQALGIDGRVDRLGPGRRLVEATPARAATLAAIHGIESVEPLLRQVRDGSARYPAGRRYSLDDWGPVGVPRAGATVELDDATWSAYRSVILRHEGAVATRGPGGFRVDGVPATHYTFERDYLFVLGDHRDDSADSRSWGFVPEGDVIGKAVMIYASWDPIDGTPRWDRFLRPVR